MRTLLAVGVDAPLLDLLRTEASSWGLVLESHSTGHTAEKPEVLTEDVDAVIVGSVPDPIRTMQRIHLLAQHAVIVFVGSEEARRVVGEALRFVPFVGTQTHVLSNVPTDDVLQGIFGAVEKARRRREHHRTLDRLNRKLAHSQGDTGKAAAALLGRLLDIAPIGVTMLDADGVIQAVNPQAVNLLGQPEGELLRQRLVELFDASEAGRLNTLLQRLNGDPALQPKEVFERGSAARLQHLEITGARLSEAVGGPHWLVLLDDVTDRIRLIEQLQQANRGKDEFLAMLGHELRNPLAPIKTAVDVMRLRGDTTAERERAIIERQVEHLVQLVDDLLDVSLITRGKLELRKQPVEVEAFIASAVEIASPLLEQKQQELHVDVPKQGLRVQGDPSRLAQVVANLLTNAAKYTDLGGRIRVTAAREGLQVVIAVEDTGRGIEPEILPRIFDLFVQDKQSLARSEGGVGLGLAIVRNLVERHGGSAEVSSEPGRGSTFVVRLPVLADDSAAPSKSETAEKGSRGAAAPDGLRILVVDDNADAASLLSDLLKASGHRTEIAHDGPSALAAAETFRPDLALVDIGLPVMDGYEVAQRMTRLPGLDRISLIAVTGYGQSEDRSRSRAAGFGAHLVKPVSFKQIRKEIERVRSKRDAT